MDNIAQVVDTSKPDPIETPTATQTETPPQSLAEKINDLATKSTDDKTTTQTPEPEYQPNYKFKVLDKEQEFDEWMRPAVKKDNEAKVRELYEKAYGLDHVKAERQTERTQREEIQNQFQHFQGQVQEVLSLKDKDLDLFFERTGVPPQKVASWLLNKLESEEKLKDLPDGMKKVYSEFDTLKRQVYDLTKQNEMLNQTSIGSAVQARSQELDSVLARQDIASMAQAFDSRVGKPGMFKQMIIRHGKDEWESSQGKRDLNAEQAVNEVVKYLGLSAQVASPATTPNEPAKAVVVPDKKPTVLPNLGSGTSASAVKRPKDLADLRRMAKDSLSQAG